MSQMPKTFADFKIQIPTGTVGEADVQCPECSPHRKKSRSPCLSVNIDKGVWICHHCGWSGTLLEGGRKADIDHWKKPRYRKPAPLPQPDLGGKTLKWFQDRGITPEVLKRNKITQAETYMPQLEGRVTAVMFPYYRKGELINAKYRDGRKNFRMEPGAERILYGIDDITESQLIWVEGEMDKLSVEVAGFRSCVSVPDGAPPPDAKNYAGKFDYLDTASEILESVKQHVIAVDADAPGARLQDELIRRLGVEKCLMVRWPAGCKDANDVLQNNGNQVLHDAIADAQQVPIDGIIEVHQLGDRIDNLYENGTQKGLTTGWNSLDDFYTVRFGEWTLVSGIPNMGKSNWVDALCVNLADYHGMKFAICSPENQPIERHVSRLMAKWIGAPFDRGPTTRMTAQEKDHARSFINAHFSFILPPDDEDWSIDNVLELARILVQRKGISGLVIDPWNELDHSRPMGISETEYISRALTKIRRFGRRNNVHIWIIAHPMKLQKDSSGDYPVPTPYDVSGSAHWRNKADNAIAIHRKLSEPGSPTEVWIQKIRFDEVGQLGDMRLQFDKPTGRYYNLDQYGIVTPPDREAA